jgi:hypothetical protein
MRIEANVVVDELLASLLKNDNITDRAEVRLSVCQLLKTLGLVKLNVTADPKNLKEIGFCFYHTEKLEYMLRNNHVGACDNNDNNNNDNNDDDNDDNNNNNNDNNDNNEDEERSKRLKLVRKI